MGYSNARRKSLKFLTDQRMIGEEQYKWISKLAEYDFEIQYKPGKENSAADALSMRSSYWEGMKTDIKSSVAACEIC